MELGAKLAFDPDGYLLSKEQKNEMGFDPDVYLKTKPAPASEIESTVRGLGQGLTFGSRDEIAGAFKSPVGAAKEIANKFGAEFSDQDVEAYKKERDEARALDKKAKEDNPGFYTAGEIGGSIATAAIPMGAMSTIGQAARSGARLGLISGVGQSEAGDAKGLVRDAAISTGMGYTFGGLAKGAGDLLTRARSGSKAATEAIEEIANDQPGSKANVLVEAAKSAKNRVKSFLDPAVDPSWEEYAEIARRNGIDPNILPASVKFGPDSSASRATRSIAEGRLGEETLKRFNAGLDKVRDAYDQKIVSYSQGAPVDEVTAGKILRDSYDEGVSRFFDQMDFTHDTIMSQAPGLQMTPAALAKIDSSLNGIEKFARGQAVRGITNTDRGQAEQLIRAVDAVRAGNGSYKQTVEALRGIGNAAFQSKNSMADIPVDVQKMRKLYNDVNESLIDTVKSQLGDDIANSLVANNKAMSEFFGDKSLISRVMGDKAIAPEKAFQSLVLSGDTKKIEALKKIIPEDQWNYLKGAVLENIVKRDPEGAFTFKQLHGAMRTKKNSLSAIFTPEELAESAGLVRLGDRFGSPVLSSSGTGASLSFQDLYQVPTNLSVDALAISNANRAANKATQKATEQIPEKAMRDVSPTLKQLPTKAAGALAGDSYTGEPKKGPEKWVSTGANKLNQAGISQDIIDSLRQSKQGRDLLIEASDASPGSKRMESVLKRIRTANQGGQ